MTVILQATVGGILFVPRTWAETSALIDRAFRKQRTWAPGRGAGDDTDFFFAEEDSEARQFPDSVLMVRVNASTGLGALIWMVNRPRAEASGREEDQWIWVTDNAHPADEDPLVLSEPWGLASVGPSVVLPVGELRAAVEEYCRAGTGDRPASVPWVHGNNLGDRDDREWEPPDYTDERVAVIAQYPDRVRALAALQLYRMLPVLEAAGVPFAGAARQILDACQAGTPAPESATKVVKSFADAEYPDGPSDWRLGSLSLNVAQLALLAAGSGSVSHPARAVVIATSNFWHHCHLILCGGETAPDWDLVTDLRRIEDQGRRREFRLLLDAQDPSATMRQELAAWTGRQSHLDAVGRAVARAAGW